MQKNSGIARLVCIFAAAIALISYNTYSYCFKGTAAEGDYTYTPSYEETPLKEEAESETAESAEASVPEKSTESAAASTQSGVEGKVISRYISPYGAGLSFDGVYMKNSTELDINIKELLSSPLSFKIEKSDSPQVLIIHTHTTETYMTEESDYYTSAFSSRTRDSSKNMVSVGNIVADKLNGAGIKTLHDATEHDYPNYTGSYTRAAETITGYLKKYPTIKVVLDLHRDSIADGSGGKIKPVTQIGGKNAAQVMLVMGNNFSSWKNNSSLAARYHQTMQVMYPGLARPISLYNKKYNQNLSNGAMLIEIGTDANTLDEALYGAQLAANALICLLNTLK